MLAALTRHSDSPCDAVTMISVDVTRPAPGILQLHYVAAGAISRVRLPHKVQSARADDLWRHTCFEAFVRTAGDAYCEFNLSPSTAWAAYRFDGYRQGMSRLETPVAPRVDVRADADALTLQATIALDSLPDFSQAARWRLGLSAVIEEADGRLSYWALAHAPGRPDFHHAASFAQDLPDPETP